MQGDIKTERMEVKEKGCKPQIHEDWRFVNFWILPAVLLLHKI